MHKLALLTLLVLFLALAPVAAQDSPDIALDWVPASFDAVIRADLTSTSALTGGPFTNLNLALFIADKIQPSRLTYTQRVNYDTFFPLGILDAEKVTFQQNVLPWIDGPVALAYRNFGEKLNVADADFLMVLPTHDTLAAASALSAAIKQQDFAKRDSYKGASLFIGDRSTIALTPGVVLIGSQAVVKAAVDAQSGAAARLVDTPAYKTIKAALPANEFLYAYVDGAQALKTVSVLLNGSDGSQPLLSALGEALKAVQSSTLETQLLTGGVKGMGFSFSVNANTQTLHGHAALYTDALPAPTPFDPSVLQVVPRSAMAVQSGADAHAAFNDALRLLPLSSYETKVLGGFVPEAANAPQPPVPPTSADIQSAVEGFTTTLKTVAGLDLDAGLAAYLKGSYALALIPRPNNPSPTTGAAFDVLIAAQVTDGTAAVQGASKLAGIVFGLPPANFQTTQIDGVDFTSAVLKATGDTLFSAGAVDHLLLVGTGDSVAEAMRARRGDNQLIKVDRWKNAVGDSPLLYVDLYAVYNLLRSSAGATSLPQIGQLGITVRDAGNGVTLFDVTANVPTG